MAQLNFNAREVDPSVSLDPIPAAWYNAVIDGSEMKPTSNGQGALLELRYNVIDGQYAGRKVFTRLNIQNQNQQTVEIAYRQLSAICHAVNVLDCADSNLLHNIPHKIKVTLRPGGPKLDKATQQPTGEFYDPSNEIRGWKNINESTDSPVPVGGAPTQQAPVQQAPAQWGAPAQQAPAQQAPQGWGGAPAQQAAPPAVQQPWANQQQAPQQHTQQPWSQPQPQQQQPMQQPQQPQQPVQPPVGSQPWAQAQQPAQQAPQQPQQQPPAQGGWGQPQQAAPQQGAPQQNAPWATQQPAPGTMGAPPAQGAQQPPWAR